jgi:hypothetical protein
MHSTLLLFSDNLQRSATLILMISYHIMIVYHFLRIFDITISLFGAVILTDSISK